MSRRVLLIYNPNAGGGSPTPFLNTLNPNGAPIPAAVVEEVVQAWSAAGWTVRQQATNGPGHATLLARAAALRNYDIVAALGGDGTVNEVINGLAGSETALAALPLGTVNVWVRELGLPVQALPAAQALVDGELRAVDLGRANGRYFLMMAGIGIDAAVTAEVRADEKRRLGALAYLLQATRLAGRYRGPRTTLIIDGRRVKGRMIQVVVGNSRLYAGLLQVTHQALIDDGLLDVCLIRGDSVLLLPWHALWVLLRRHSNNPDIEYYRARSVTIAASRPLAVQVDGEAIGTTPMTFEIAPRALRVLIPRAVPQELFSSLSDRTHLRPVDNLGNALRGLPWPIGPR
jgi:YegS/Rv2252/BmrU family lipid kinase